MILGTAGHVDHGKTALVKALTGVDTDRLAEEKRRGITIDLGFAPLALGDVRLGVVDVPGHEAFVRNMLAGATGIDLALLVIAADEGVMPQTREHLAILDLLGIAGGVIALTKVDLVDAEWRELVREDVRAAIAGSGLAGAAIVGTSVVTGEGLDALRAALAAAAAALPARTGNDLFRLPIDRAFTVRGTGTVVTGTVWSGTLERDAVVRVVPGDRPARVRGIEAHGAAVTRALPGTRAAIALAGLELSDVRRGDALVTGDGWDDTRVVIAEVALLEPASRVLGPRTIVRFHLGTSEVGARIVTAGGALAPGERKAARIALDAPVVARAGDRFVLRSASPLTTIGGGVIVDPLPPHRRARPWSAPAARARLEHVLEHAGAHGIVLAALPVRLGVPPPAVDALLATLGDSARRVGDRLHAAAALDALGNALVAAVDAHHVAHPLEPGASLQSIRARLGADAALIDRVLRERVDAGALAVTGSLVHRREWAPRLSPEQTRARDALAVALAAAGREPPSLPELAARFGADTEALMRLLEREGRVVAVESDRYYAREALAGMVETLQRAMHPDREYTPAELREALGFSRKFLIPFLEYCDRTGITERRTSGRVLGRARASTHVA